MAEEEKRRLSKSSKLAFQSTALSPQNKKEAFLQQYKAEADVLLTSGQGLQTPQSDSTQASGQGRRLLRAPTGIFSGSHK